MNTLSICEPFLKYNKDLVNIILDYAKPFNILVLGLGRNIDDLSSFFPLCQSVVVLSSYKDTFRKQKLDTVAKNIICLPVSTVSFSLRSAMIGTMILQLFAEKWQEWQEISDDFLPHNPSDVFLVIPIVSFDEGHIAYKPNWKSELCHLNPNHIYPISGNTLTPVVVMYSLKNISQFILFTDMSVEEGIEMKELSNLPPWPQVEYSITENITLESIFWKTQIDIWGESLNKLKADMEELHKSFESDKTFLTNQA
jgi:hypothetical protein